MIVGATVPAAAPSGREGRGEWAGVAAAVTVALALRLYALGSQPLWMDEVASLRNALAVRAGGVAAVAAVDHVAPLSHALEAASIAVGGPTEFWLRLPAAVAGVATVLLVHLLARRLGATRRVRVAAVFLVAVNPLAVWYSQEARMYSLLLAIAVGYLVVCWRFVEGRATGRTVVAAAFLCAAGLWTHHYLALLVCAFGLFLLVVRGWRDRQFWWWTAAQAGGALLFVPWLVLTSQRSEGTGFEKAGLLAWFPYTVVTFFSGLSMGPSVRELREQPLTVALAANAPALALITACCVVVLVVGARYWWQQSRRIAGFLLCCGTVPIILAIAVTVPTGVSYNVRYAITALPAWILLTAGAIAGHPRRTGSRVAAGLVALVTVVSLVGWYGNDRYAKEDLRSAAAALRAQAAPEDRVILDGVNARLALGYYGWTCRPGDVAVQSPVGADALALALSRRSSPGRTWLLVYRPWETDPAGVVESSLGAAGGLRTVAGWPGVRLLAADGVTDFPQAPGLVLGCAD